MIVARIWLIDKRSAALPYYSSPSGGVHLQFIVRVVIESALLYTGTSIFAFIAVILANNLSYIATNIVSRRATCHPLTDVYSPRTYKSSGSHLTSS
jgi:hypothetical protein